MDNKYTSLGKYASLFSMTLLTGLAIHNKSITVFYMIYMFWCDEVLRTIFDRLRYHFKRDQLENPANFIANLKSRAFMLAIYFVFIFVFFCLMFNWGNNDLIFINLRALMFQHPLFNMSLITFLIREIYLYRNNVPSDSFHLLSRGVITLHISIIFGVAAWFLIKENFVFLKNHLSIIAIVPFLLLKLFFEIGEIKDSRVEKSDKIN